MKLNKEKSKRNIKLLLLAVGLAVTIGDGLSIVDNLNTDKYREEHFRYEETQREYYDNIKNANLDDFDLDFVYLCSDGRIKIFENEYSLKDLYISKGTTDKGETVYIQDYKNPNNNLLNGEDTDPSYKREKIMQFIYSNAFYQLYSSIPYSNVLEINEDNYDTFSEIMLNFDATMHDKLPETYYSTNPNVVKSTR